MRWLELGVLAEFLDRSGIVRQTAGCSLVGRFEFAERLRQLEEILSELPPDRAWVDEYASAARFKHVIDRLLALNGLESDWFTPDMVSVLLFGRVNVDGQILPGWLIELNQGTTPQPIQGEESTSLAQSVAGLSESLIEALELAENVPAQLLIEIAKARAELCKTPEQKAEDKKQQIFDELRNDSRLEEILSG